MGEINGIYHQIGGVDIPTRDRGGRLDICLLSENHLLVAETKVNFKKMMQEGRYLSQMLAYEEEIKRNLTQLNIDLKFYKFLLIDGNETDLLPPNHALCTSKEGEQATLFYNHLKQHKLFFISATALLLLGILKLFRGDKFSIETVLDNVFSQNALGLLSCGAVVVDNQNNCYIKILDITQSYKGKT